jgi:hypothetical protein
MGISGTSSLTVFLTEIDLLPPINSRYQILAGGAYEFPDPKERRQLDVGGVAAAP